MNENSLGVVFSSGGLAGAERSGGVQVSQQHGPTESESY
jgi:hypothetical protein